MNTVGDTVNDSYGSTAGFLSSFSITDWSKVLFSLCADSRETTLNPV